MKKMVYYPEYLQLDKLLDAQECLSEKDGQLAHDEHLFIMIHQVYELWFKQILFEVSSCINILDQEYVKEKEMYKLNHRLNRVVEIQKILVSQLDVMETMTSMDFMEFRDILTPASGFQSIQFRQLEIKLGLTQNHRMPSEKNYFNSRLKTEDREFLENLDLESNLFSVVEKWLERLPFTQDKSFNYWKEFQLALKDTFKKDKETIESNPTLSEVQKKFELKNLDLTIASFETLFDKDRYNETSRRLSQEATLSALFIFLNRDEPVLAPAFQFIEKLLDIDEHMTRWRYRHAIMVHRILGNKIGTGGSSGHDYLKKAAENGRVFKDFFDLASFLVPRNQLPELPEHILKQLGFSTH